MKITGFVLLTIVVVILKSVDLSIAHHFKNWKPLKDWFPPRYENEEYAAPKPHYEYEPKSDKYASEEEQRQPETPTPHLNIINNYNYHIDPSVVVPAVPSNQPQQSYSPQQSYPPQQAYAPPQAQPMYVEPQPLIQPIFYAQPQEEQHYEQVYPSPQGCNLGQPQEQIEGVAPVEQHYQDADEAAYYNQFLEAQQPEQQYEQYHIEHDPAQLQQYYLNDDSPNLESHLDFPVLFHIPFLEPTHYYEPEPYVHRECHCPGMSAYGGESSGQYKENANDPYIAARKDMAATTSVTTTEMQNNETETVPATTPNPPTPTTPSILAFITGLLQIKTTTHSPRARIHSTSEEANEPALHNTSPTTVRMPMGPANSDVKENEIEEGKKPLIPFLSPAKRTEHTLKRMMELAAEKDKSGSKSPNAN